MKKHNSIRAISVIIAVIMLAITLYVPGIVSADASVFNADDYALIYDYYKNGEDEHYVEGQLTDSTKADFGISSFGGVLERKTGKQEGVIDTTWNYQYQNGLANSHVVYEVEKGTSFYAEFVPIWGPGIQSYANKKDYKIILFGWNDETTKWEEATAVVVTKDNYDSGKSLYTVVLKPEENIYSKIKILWPSKVDNTDVGDDALGLSGVALTPPKPEAVYDYTKIYDYYKNGEDEHYVEGQLTDSTKADFGISSFGGVLERKTGKQEGVIDTTWTYQYNNGLANSHIVYETQKGTAFRAEFVPIWAPNIQGYANKKDYKIILYGWNSEISDWEEATAVVVTKDNYDSSKSLYSVTLKPEDNVYSKIKILWPSKVDNTDVGDDALGLSGVSLTPPKPDTRVSYEYFNLEQLPLDESKNMGPSLNMTLSPPALGMYRLSGGSAVSNLNRNKSKSGIIQPTWTAVYSVNAGEAEFFVDYEVMGGSVFTATVTVDNNISWGKPVWESMPCYAGRYFEFKFLTSPDGVNWTQATSTAEKHGQIYVDINVPEDANYVRVLFPQDGNPNGKNNAGKVFNDMASLDAVKYEPSENSKYGSYFDFNKNGANKLKYDDTNYNYFLFKEYNGVEIFEGENGFAALGAAESYAQNGAEEKRPYITYLVKADSEVKITVTKDAEKCDLMGADWDVKIYESSDNTEWYPISETPEIKDGVGLGRNETYKFKTKSATKYLKIEFPHSGEVDGETGAKLIGIANLGINPEEYEAFEPYGNNTYGEKIDYTDSAVFTMKENITAAVNGKYSLYDAGISAMYYNMGIGIQASWNYLDKAKDVPKPFVVYNVKSGTSFQTEITFNSSAIPTIEDAIGKDYEPKLYISSDNSVWKEYCDSSLRLTSSAIKAGRSAFILTIDKIPEGISFVKIELPQDNDASVASGGAFPYAGNDIIEIATVSLTKGDLPDPNNFQLDESLYEEIIDFAVDDINKREDISPYAMSWMPSYALAGPSYSYFESSGENKRTKPNVVVPVQGGKPFFTEIQVRPNIYNSFLEGTYDSKVYVSVDGSVWEDVTLKYRQRSGAGGAGFGLCERYQFTPDENVKYVKIEMPNDRTYAGYVTNKGVRLSYIGNDYLGIRKIAFTPREENVYEHTVSFTEIYNKYSDYSIPDDISDEVKSVLGLYDYTPEALTVQEYQGLIDGVLSSRYIMQIREAYVVGQTKLDRCYITYNVKPGTAFEATMFANDDILSYSAPNIRMKAYVSPTGKDGSWTEVTDVFSYVRNNELSIDTKIRLTIDNVGEDTNFVKLEFPQDGDYGIINPAATQQVGHDFFGIESVRATLVEYDGTFEGVKKENPIFLNPNQQITVTVPNENNDIEEPEDDYEEEYEDYEDYYEDEYVDYGDFEYAEDEETEIEESVSNEKVKKTKKYRVTKKMLIPDGYTYALWFIILCIAGGVAVLAGIAVLVIVLIKVNKKRKAN